MLHRCCGEVVGTVGWTNEEQNLDTRDWDSHPASYVLGYKNTLVKVGKDGGFGKILKLNLF